MSVEYANNLLEFAISKPELNYLLDISPAASYPYQNYFGINYNQRGIETVKFYFSFYKLPKEKVIGDYLGDDRYKKYIQYFRQVKTRSLADTGFTLSLKIDKNKNLTRGFHFRFVQPGQVQKPKTRDLASLSLLNTGYCVEYGKIAKEKHYFYYTTAEAREKFFKLYKRPHILHSDFIEYTESGKERKIITTNTDQNPAYQKKWKIDFSVGQKLYDHFTRSGFNADIGYGIYDNNPTRALYFYWLNGIKKQPFTHPKNFHIHSIEKWLKQL